MPGSPGALRTLPDDARVAPAVRPHRTLRLLAVLTLACTFALIAVGGLVRATGSGLGCTGWPKCTGGSWLPPLEHHALIEYSHRFVAFLDVVLVALLATTAVRRYRTVRRVVGPAIAAAGFVVVQAILGGIVVHGDLAAVLVSAHLGTAMLLAGSVVLATVGAFSPSHAGSAVSGRSAETLGGAGSTRAVPVRRIRVLAWVAAGSVLILILVGATVRAEGAGLAFADWPLFDGEVVPALAGLGPALQFAHRLLALESGILVATLALLAWRTRRRAPAVWPLAALAAGLLAVQVVIGAAAVWSRLAPAAIVGHVTVSSLVWGALVATAAVAAPAAVPGRRTVPAGDRPSAAPAQVVGP